MAKDAFNVSVDNFFFQWFFYTLIPILSAVFLVMTWTVQNIAITGAMLLDFVFLIGVNSSAEKYTVNMFRVLFIALCQFLIYLVEIFVIIVSWIPVVNIPINLVLMAIILFLNWRIDIALERPILVPINEPPAEVEEIIEEME